MLRGINKQIIEIKCTNNEYFEKILLFVRGDKADSPCEILQGQAASYCSAFTSRNPKRKLRIFTKRAAFFAALCILGFGVGVGAAALLL